MIWTVGEERAATAALTAATTTLLDGLVEPARPKDRVALLRGLVARGGPSALAYVHARTAFAQPYLPLVGSLAAGLGGDAELFSEGQAALLDALDRWRPRPGLRFVSYAYPVIRCRMVTLLRRRARALVVEAEVSAQDDAVDPERALVEAETLERRMELLGPNLRRLTMLQRRVLRLLYGEQCSQGEAAAALGVSHQAVAATHQRALARLRSGMGVEQAAAPVVSAPVAMTTSRTDMRAAERRRWREHDAWFTPGDVAEQVLRGVADLGVAPATILDLGAGAGVWGQRAAFVWPAARRRAVELRAEERPHLERWYHEVSIGDFRDMAPPAVDLVIGNFAFHLMIEKLRWALERARWALTIVPAGFGAEERAEQLLLTAPPSDALRLSGRIAFLDIAVDGTTRAGTDFQHHEALLWRRDRAPGVGWHTHLLPPLPASSRRWLVRPGEELTPRPLSVHFHPRLRGRHG